VLRNTLQERYECEAAQHSYGVRRKTKPKGKRTVEQLEDITACLLATWPPEQIANTATAGIVSFKTIYRWLYSGFLTTVNTQTQIPSKYKLTYTLSRDVIVDEFENINPDDTVSNSSQEVTSNSTPKIAPQVTTEGDLSKIDTNGNGIVTIAEAKKSWI